jgi:CheY-like chemotaxis protein
MRQARPCFLVVDREYPCSISARKLVLESAKLNVITAYSPDEAIDTLERFPNVDGIVLDTEMHSRTCRELMDQLRTKRADIPIITVSPSGHNPCGDEWFHVSSFDPEKLLAALAKLIPNETKQIIKEEEDCSEKKMSG